MAITTPEKRISDFEKLGFGMFIHWGLYSQIGKGEWVMYMSNIPKDEYSKLINTFTAEDFDAKKITSLARRAGMKYITLTTRHHEGFSLYDTCGLCDYDAPHSPAKRDLIKEFVEACNEDGILPMFYHTTLDWYQASFENNFDSYLEYLSKSVEILCTNYGKIGGFWFDGNWSKPQADWKEAALYAIIRKHQPDAMIINNTGLGQGGVLGNIELDSVTFEQSKPTPLNREGIPKYYAAEMCQTINSHWGIGVNDFNYKSTGELIETLCHSRKVGANYLLNIGPTAQGGILKIQEALLENVGEWIRLCGNSIYDGKPSNIICQGNDFVLNTENDAYIYVFNLSISGHENVTVVGVSGAGKRMLENVVRPVQSICWVDNNELLEFIQDIEGKILTFNATGYPYGTNTVVRVAKIIYS